MTSIGGSGIFGLVQFLIIVLGMISGATVLYSTNYFNLEPKYYCQNSSNDNFTCWANEIPEDEI